LGNLVVVVGQYNLHHVLLEEAEEQQTVLSEEIAQADPVIRRAVFLALGVDLSYRLFTSSVHSIMLSRILNS
jgi:hypothetical protein